MTDDEIKCMQHLVDFWNSYLKLPDNIEISTSEINSSVNNILGMLAIRVAKRVNPEIWR
jgi:hypothetical protein